MRLTTHGPIALGGAVLLGAFLISGYAVSHLMGRLPREAARPEAAGPPTPPPAARDSLNPGIWIEAGTYVKGSDHPGESGDPASPFHTGDERPARRLAVGGFWIQQHEVTNAEYRRYDPGHRFPAGKERHPVVNVTWGEAMAYAASLGGTLPTEAEWERAAEGTENRSYPWGEEAPTCERAHHAGCAPSGTVEVLSRPEGATPEGVHGLAGNVWEWVVPMWFVAGRTPVNEESRALRGGSFQSPPFFLRPSKRSTGHHGSSRFDDTGFRVVWRPGDRG